MVQMMWIVVVLNVECFTSANIGYIFRYDMSEGREITTCAEQCLGSAPGIALCSVWCPLQMWRIVCDRQCLSFKRRLKWAQGEAAERFSEGFSRLQSIGPALLTLGPLGAL